MKAFDIDQELADLAAKEEVLAFFDFELALDGEQRVEGLCKVSRPRERRSRSTYCSLLFVIDAPDAAAQRSLEGRLGAIDWNAFAAATPGVECVLAVPRRAGGGGLFLKEVDVYLDGSRDADASFAREVLQPAIARATSAKAGEVTVWNEAGDQPAKPAEAKPESFLDRLRRFAGRA